jgi:thiamine monophosphate kinase
MFIQENYVRVAIAKAGGPTVVSNQIGVSNACVHLWVKKRRVANMEKAKKLAELSGMALDKLRNW